MHIHELARLMKELRQAQRSGGKGYKTPADHDRASSLEKRVDHAIATILHADGTPTPPAS